MSTGTIIGECLIAAFCLFLGVLMLAAAIKQKQAGKDVERNKQDHAGDPLVLSALRDEFRALRMANEGSYTGRQDLGVLSTIIQKLERGEAVETSAIVFLLSRMRGTEALIEKIKEEGA